MNKCGLAPEYESQPPGGLLLMLIKIIVLEINSTLKGIRKHHIDFLGGPLSFYLLRTLQRTLQLIPGLARETD